MAAIQLMAIMLRAGDTIRWLLPGAELAVGQLVVKRVRYGEPVAGRIVVEIEGRAKPLRLGARAPVSIIVTPE